MKTQCPVISISAVTSIIFFKRDEITTDLICCEVTVTGVEGTQTYLFHEDLPYFDELITQFETLDGFDMKWREKVVLPPFAENRTVAYERKDLAITRP